MTATNYWVYILNCENNTLYTGYTTDLSRRWKEHLEGTSKCKYTRSFKAHSIAQYWQIHGNKSQAMKVEYYIKNLSKRKKLQLIESPSVLSKQFGSELFAKFTGAHLQALE